MSTAYGSQVLITLCNALQICSSKTEVRGKISLELLHPNKKITTIHRLFMLKNSELSAAKKANGASSKPQKPFKTMDTTMIYEDVHGRERTISESCIKMNIAVPEKMDVSRAVLEHVVFVHQEDSLWPLAESKPVKDRFDAIFASTKYTDAVGKMQALIKDKKAVRFCPCSA
jgi:DNA repair protein RAD50